MFDGSDYIEERDFSRLSLQADRVFNLMIDGKKRTLAQISKATGDPEASVSAQLRNFRKKKFGSYIVEKEYIDNGLFTYWVLPPFTDEEEYDMDDGEGWIVDTTDKLNSFVDFVCDSFKAGKHNLYSIKNASRSMRQNNAMHLWFRQLAQELNDAGHTMPHPFDNEFELSFTELRVKEILFRPIIEAMYGKSSTSKLTAKELGNAAEELIRYLSEHKGVYVPWPQSMKDQMR